MNEQHNEKTAVVTIGCAVRPHGGGIAFVAVSGRAAERESFVRVGFSCRPLPALLGRDVSYAALTAVAEMLLRRGVRCVDLRIDDAAVAADLAERRFVPAALTIPYVALRCKLNRFVAATVISVGSNLLRDLVARARAEASLDVAA